MRRLKRSQIAEIVAFDREERGVNCRRTLRYNFVDVLPKWRDGVRDAEIVHVAVRLDRALQPVVKDVARISLRNGTVSYRDLGYHGLGGWIVYWNRSDYERKSVRAWIYPPPLGEWVTEKLGRSQSLAFPWRPRRRATSPARTSRATASGSSRGCGSTVRSRVSRRSRRPGYTS